MYLNELAVAIFDSLLVQSRLCAAGANDRVGRFAKDQSDSASRYNDRVGRKRFDFQGAQIHCGQTSATTVVVLHHREHFPMLQFSNQTFCFVMSYLFIERVEQLLAS